MKDFDEGRTRRNEKPQGFRIKGQEFRVNPAISIAALDAYENREVTRMSDVRQSEIDLIEQFLLDDASRKAWKKALTDTSDPITPGDLTAIVTYLYELAGEVPTIAPARSSGSGAIDSTTSKGSTS